MMMMMMMMMMMTVYPCADVRLILDSNGLFFLYFQKILQNTALMLI